MANLSFEIHFDVDLAASDVIDSFQAGLVAVAPRFCDTLRVMAHEGDRAAISIDLSDSQALLQAVVRKGTTRGGTFARLSADSPPKYSRRFGNALIRGKAPSTFLTVRFDEHAPAMRSGDEWLWSNSVSANTKAAGIGRMTTGDWIEQLLGTLVEHSAVLWGAAFDREEFAARNIDTTYGMRAVGRDVRSSLPGLYWLNVYGARYVDLIGGDRLRSAPRVLGAPGATASAPFVVLWAYAEWNVAVVILCVGMSLPLIACIVWTLVQQRRRDFDPTSLAPNPLAVSAIMIAASVIAICLLGLLGALLAFLLVPAAAAFLALAWVQPRDSDTVPTVILGVGLPPLIAWFAGRADEYVREGVISAISIAAIIAVLALLRRRGDLASTTAHP